MKAAIFVGRVAGVRGQSQRGVALAIVVWFIAGMSLLVAGIVSHARVDTRMAQLHVAGAKAAAAGDGAIQLMMASLVTGRLDSAPPGQLPRARFRLGSAEAEVTLVPVNGLLDINTAPPKFLAILFHRIGGLDPSEAKTVADNVIKWRKMAGRGNKAGRSGRFAAVEDLLRVEGINRALYDEVRDYLAVGMGNRGGTNWSVAPDNVMALLREADPQKSAAAARQSKRSGSDGEGTVASGRGQAYRLDAFVRYGDDWWLRRRWIKMESVSGSSLPWRSVRTESPRVVNRATVNNNGIVGG